MPKAPSVAFSSPVSHPSFFIIGLTVYSMVAMDVFYPDGLHLLQPVDQAIHQAVLENIDPALRRQLFGNVVSNVWSLASSVGWIFATATALSRRNPLAWQSCALGWALWIFGVGPIEHDPALMEALKDGFGRARPSPVHRTASFPSGHTACAVLLVGALLFVLLPVVYGSKPGKGGGGSGGVSRGDGEEGEAAVVGSGGGAGGKGSHPIFDAIYSVQFSWGLWAASALTTIVGRVGVDAHWLSDTLAGAALSVALVSGLASATERLAGGAAGGGDGGKNALRGD
ncbi:hypothetical protein PLESTM_000393000 [Pleodorina starrii]|nr:hypothetical protein PLESTM_000393000 [Pleodorina starrii]